jgi:hypothetical protein
MKPSLYIRSGSASKRERGKRRRQRRLLGESLEHRWVLDSTLVINEIMYHPADTSTVGEWVELHNQMSVDLDVSGWTLRGGIDYSFLDGTIIPGGGHVVVAADPDALAVEATAAQIVGPFTGQLSNSGESLRLVDNNDRLMNETNYSDDVPWPVGPDGSGVSLAKYAPNSSSESANNWSFSRELGGTPGEENFPDPTLLPREFDTLVESQSDWRVLVPDQAGDLDPSWNSIGFDDQADANWFDRTAGIGFDSAGVSGVANRVDTNGDISVDMEGVNSSAFARQSFNLSNPADYDQLLLDVEFDDGIIATINGVEVARENVAAGPTSWDAASSEEARLGYSNTVLDVANDGVSAAVGYWRLGETPGAAIAENEGSAGAPLAANYLNHSSSAAGLVDDDDPSASFNGVQSESGTHLRGSGLNSAMGDNPFVGDWTIEAWLVHNANHSWSGVFSNSVSAGGPLMTFINTTNSLGINGAGVTGNNVSVDLGPNHFGKPIYSVITKTGGNATGQAALTVYVNLDGEWLSTASGTNSGWNLTPQDGFLIGRHWNSGTQIHDGSIDEVGIYDRALSAADVEQHFLASGRTSSNSLAGQTLAPSFGKVTLDITSHLTDLQTGNNVLAIHGLNRTVNDADFLISAELRARQIPDLGVPPVSLRINEIASASDPFWLELLNTGDDVVPLTGVVVAGDSAGNQAGHEVTLAGGWLNPGEYLQLDQTDLGFQPAAGDNVFLFAPARSELLDAASVENRLRGRSDAHNGQWLYPDTATPGAENSFSLTDDIVINEILYHAQPTYAREQIVEQSTLVQFDSQWSSDQSGVDRGTTWRETGFDDSTWPVATAAFSSGISGANYSALITADSPAAYWRLDEDPPTGIALDSAPQNGQQNGAYNNASTASSLLTGDTNPAVEFDGSSTFIDGLGIGSIFQQDWTIEAWFTRDAVTDWSGVFSNSVAAGGPLMTFISTSNQLGINGAGVTGNNVSVDLGPDHLGKLVYAAITKTGANGVGQAELTVHANVDGQWLTPATGTNNGWALTPQDSYFIGRHWGSALQIHDGVIDEVAIYSHALSLDEVESHYQAGSFDSGEVTNAPLQLGPSTHYFRHDFNFSGDLQLIDSLEVNALVDDGAVFYLNGTEVARWNMPAGNLDYSTPANVETIADFETGWIELSTPALVNGNNVLAVELHQAAGDTSDGLFAAELRVGEITTTGRDFLANDEEWIELYNGGAQPIELSGWSIDGDIDYQFPTNTMLLADQYIVVSNNAADLSSRHPAITILGDFAGQLKNSSGNIRLLDQHGNPVDELTYYDGGRWAEYADGGGSSLELRDPSSDNSQPESWTHSAETNRTQWNSYSYRGVVAADIGPTNFNEFIFGLLDDGEILLDDIQVVEDPNGTARQLIQNGGFDSGDSSTWRIIGNHEQAQVVPDPDDIGNPVLHLMATGPTEHLSNHAETTLKHSGNFVTIENGMEYEISFRARWISGSPQLHSRFYFNRLAKTTIIETPDFVGTPGAENSTVIANSGPTYVQLLHFPVVPLANESVTVSIEAEDADGVVDLNLWYAVDGGSWMTVNMAPTGTAFEATIPSAAAGATVQFYVAGQDALGAVSHFPATGPESRALYRVEDGQAQLQSLHNFRIITTDLDANRLHENTNLTSNALQGATVIYDEREVFYDVGVRLKGSVYGRPFDNLVSYIVQFDPAQLFRGVHRSVSVDRSARGPVGSPNIDELLIKHVASVAGGIVSRYDDVIRVIAPRSQHSSVAQLGMALYGDVFLDSQFPNGGDYPVHEFDGAYYLTRTTDGDPESLKVVEPGPISYTDIRDLGDDKEAYRLNWIIKDQRAEDDFSHILEMNQAFSLPANELDAVIDEIIDVDQWMRALALVSLTGVVDSYTLGNPHNLRVYERPTDGRIILLPHDMDTSFRRAVDASLYGAANWNLVRILERPQFLRVYLGHLLDLIENTYNEEYMEQWTEHYGQLAGSDFTGILNYIRDRGNFVLGQLPLQVPVTPFEITTNGGQDFATDQPTVALQGNGWIDVDQLRQAGSSSSLIVSWTDEDSWEVVLPLAPGANEFTIEAYDRQGVLLDIDTITVTTTAQQPTLVDALRISEVMYHPHDPPMGSVWDADQFEFIELTNIGNAAVDLSDAAFVDGVAFTFPMMTLEPGEFVLVVRNQAAFESRYGSGLTIAGEFSGGLRNSGETMQLNDSAGTAISLFSYDDTGAWPGRADGNGSSLEVLDLAANYDTPDNWQSSVQFGGTPGGTILLPVGDVVINEVLTHTDLPALDSIELHNTTNVDIGIGGWFISDSNNDYRKFRIPAGTMLLGNSYIVFDEDDFNPTMGVGVNDFGLDGAHGDDVWLVAALADGTLTRFVDRVEFIAAANGESFGRWPNATGDLYPMIANTFGGVNSGPRVGPLTFSELMYHPMSDDPNLEFVEIYNPTGAAVELTNWQISGGVSFAFPAGFSIGSEEYLVIVPFDPLHNDNLALAEQFLREYDVSNINWLGGYSGQLDNGGERLQLLRPDTPPLDEPEVIPLLLEDEVNYGETSPWAEAADGRGFTLSRIGDNSWGNDPLSWTSDSPTPGRGDSAPSVQSVTINAGFDDPDDLPKGTQPSSWQQQRSDIRTLTVNFSEPVVVTSTDIVLTNLGIDADADQDAVIPLTVAHLNSEDNRLTISFAANELPNGVYQLELLTTVSDSADQSLASFVMAGNVDNRFFKLTAEWNGDTGVSVFDFTTFSYWFGISIPTAPIYADLNDDGGISVFDFSGFSSNFGIGVTYPVGFVGRVDSSIAREEEQSLLRQRLPTNEVARANDTALEAIMAEWNALDPFTVRDVQLAFAGEVERFWEEEGPLIDPDVHE